MDMPSPPLDPMPTTVNHSLPYAHMSDKERQDHAEYLKEHAGHESQHSLMFLIIVVSLFAFQLVLVLWRQKYPRSFNLCTLVGLWLIPPIVFLLQEPGPSQYIRFYTVWMLFSAGNGLILHAATQRPLSHMTPRIVYSWFYRIYQLCLALGIVGYAMIFAELFGLTAIFFSNSDPQARTWFAFGFYTLIYGLYFGVMGRDMAQLLADYMASTIGYYSQEGFPQKHLRENICALCGDTVALDADRLELECRHVFHEGCIRGWCLVGKKDMCPYCKEKVDLKLFRRQIWDTQTDLYLQLLDVVRYLVVWQPLILGFAHLAIKVFGLQ